jgi:hypothetical protein
MVGSFRLRRLMPLGALVVAIMLGGCVYPAYPGYGYYNGYYGGPYYGGPYYGGGVVAFGGGWRGGWHDHGWGR